MIAFIKKRKIIDSNNMKHVIVCGYSRSGTTMFYNMLRTSLTGYGFFEKEVSACDVIGLENQSYMSKSPLDIFNLDNIIKANRFSKQIILLILIRDIRSIITSYHKAVPDDYFIAYDLQYSPDYDGNLTYKNPGVIPTANAIEKATSNINFKSIILRYEDLITNSEEQESKLKNQLNFEFKDHFKNFYHHPIPEKLMRQLNNSRPLDITRLDAWKRPEHSQRIRSQFTRCPALFDLLITYGYETNRDWFEIYRRNSTSYLTESP
jgi:hypothetical protein